MPIILPDAKYEEIPSRPLRLLLRFMHSLWFIIPYVAFYFLMWPVRRVFRRLASGWHPAELRIRLYHYAVGFAEHTDALNTKRLEEANRKAVLAQERRQWLEQSIGSSEGLRQEALRIKETIRIHLERLNDSQSLFGAEDSSKRCLEALATLPDAVQIDAVALTAEALRRQLDGIVLHQVQFAACFSLNKGHFIELRNGEGKTFVAVPVLVWGALRHKALREFAKSLSKQSPFSACFAFTANDYLVRRDFAWLKSIYESLDISASYMQGGFTREGQRRLAYGADVIFITGTEYGFDELRNASRQFGSEGFEQNPFLILVDEADQLLLDEAITPLILSGSPNTASPTFIEPAWVAQTDLWVEEIFRANRFAMEEEEGLVLTTAGRIFCRTWFAELGIEDWAELASCLRRTGLYPWVLLIAELLLKADAFRQQLSPESLARLESAIGTNARPELIVRIPGGRLKATAELRHTLNSAVAASDITFREGMDAFRWVLRNMVLAHITVEDKAYFRRAQKRLLRIALNRDFFINGLEFLINEVAENTKQKVSPRLIQGLEALATFGSRNSWIPVISWSLYDAIPWLFGIITPAADRIAGAQESTDVAKDLQILVRMWRVMASVPSRDANTNPSIELLKQRSMFAAALLDNFLYSPESGLLTSAGRRVATYIEAACHDQELLASEEAGNVVDYISKSLHAYCSLVEGRDYVIKQFQVVLVNQVTGRPEPSKHYGRSLHPFVQAKHGLRIQEPQATLRSTTIQSIAARVPQLVGMSGTLLTQEQDLRNVCSRQADGKSVLVVIPPRVPPRLTGEKSLIYLTREDKWAGICSEVLAVRQNSVQPILIIAATVEHSGQIFERLKSAFGSKGVSQTIHLLNAQSEEVEEEIISWAGIPGAVTVATQMVARGTDIIIPRDSVRAGGLYVIVAEHHESPRLDQQAQGRAARQGDPGRVRFYSSLDDKVFAGGLANLRQTMERLGLSEDTAVEAGETIQESIRAAQDSIQFNQRRQRELTANIDAIVDAYRREAHGLREHFVPGRGEELEAGLLAVAGMIAEEMGRKVGPVSVAGWVEEILAQIQARPEGLESICADCSVRFGFPLSKEAFEKVAAEYARQKTPYLSIDGRDVWMSVVVRQGLLEQARKADLATIHQQWNQWEQDFQLTKGLDPEALTKLRAHLRSTLVLGFDSFAWQKTLEYLKDSTASGKTAAAMLRTAVLDVLREPPSEPDLTPPSSNGEFFGRLREGKSLEEVRGWLRGAIAGDLVTEELRELMCRAALAAFDRRWERVLDEVEIEARKAGAAYAPFSLMHQISVLFERFFRDWTRDVMEAFEGRKTWAARQAPAQRWLPIGSLGLPWSEETQIADIEEPESLARARLEIEEAQLALCTSPDGNQQDIPVAGGNLEELTTQPEPEVLAQAVAAGSLLSGEPGVEDAMAGNTETEQLPVRATSTQADVAPVDPRAGDVEENAAEALTDDDRPRFEDPDGGIDEVLEAADEQISDDELMYRAVYYLQRNELLLAAVCLRRVGNQAASELLKEIYRVLGCEAQEIRHLRSVRASGKITSKLLIRLAEVLGRGTIPERGEAIDILSREAVPPAESARRDDDISALDALRLSMQMLVSFGEHETAVALFTERSDVGLILDVEALPLFDLVAEALAHSGEERRAAFERHFGSPWREWIEQLYAGVCLRPEFKGDEEQVDRLLLRLALFAGLQPHTLYAIHRVRSHRTPGFWQILETSFAAAGYMADSKLAQCRSLIESEDYETAVGVSRELLRSHPGDTEIQASHIYAMLGVVRGVKDHLYGKEVAANYLPQCIEALRNWPEGGENAEVQELLTEALCLNGDFDEAAALAGVMQRRSIWGLEALLRTRIDRQEDVGRIQAAVSEISPRTPEEWRHCCAIVNSWFEGVRAINPSLWKQGETKAVLEALGLLWEPLAQQSDYQAFWQLGIATRLEADWLRDNGRDSESLPFLRAAVEHWNQALPLTRQNYAPFRLMLPQHEELNREMIEVSLRRCLRRIKAIESQMTP